MSDGPWTCFFCGDTFADRAAARAHFGGDEECAPACQIKASEGGLVRVLRETEEALYRATCALHDESAEGVKAMRAMVGRFGGAVIAAEEAGYDRGLRDRDRQIETLRRALVWHGDLARMATTREDWQQEIDEAIGWVKDHPEDGRPSFPTFAAGGSQ